MKTAGDWFDEYSLSHRNQTNKLLHWICIPLIMFGTLGLLWVLPRGGLSGVLPNQIDPFLNWATILGVAALLFYLRLSPKLFVGMWVVGTLMVVLIHAVNLWSPIPLTTVCVTILVLAWIGQFVGHRFEGVKPSFFKDLQFLLIGPAWLLNAIYRRLGIRL